ncbi:aminotransferase class I/II-fold pyridoxal phosphate-dependent enzyme [Candidatus Gottesmanbacteria bacterium]|nr:aminotransferase class I/II-fold pyridoxal phosphate-dependent enzyme [Candidatus Gottesmanbacteria bacterium]
MNFQQIISPSLSPNTEANDVREALRVLMRPSSWQQGRAIGEVEEWFRDYLNTSTAVSLDSGRSALLAILQSFGIGRGDEVITQAFTCVAVPNSIRWAGATPIYADIDDSFNVDPADASRKITKRTKAIIVQHTFGTPATMDEILALAAKHKLLIIEDCAHSLGATYKGKKVGTLGDAAFFSFGRDKAVSSVWGGVATLNIKYQISNIKYKLEKFQEHLPYPSRAWIGQQLVHPVAFAGILPTYNLLIGKVVLELLKRTECISMPVCPQEKRGEKPSWMPRRYPNALAQLLVGQLTKLERYIQIRRRTARAYHQALRSKSRVTLPDIDMQSSYLRLPILAGDRDCLQQKAKRSGVLLGNWYHHVIDPIGVDLGKLGYASGSCPRAEDAAARTVNLPTLINKKEAERVISLF